MTSKTQKIAIAEMCGWSINVTEHFKVLRPPEHAEGTGHCCGKHLTDEECFEAWFDFAIPDYLSDLNAMHEAEKVLTDKQFKRFMDLLANNFDETKIYPNRWRLVSATASQRAEAFLRTLNLWTE